MAASIFVEWWQWARCSHAAKLKSNGSKPIGPATAMPLSAGRNQSVADVAHESLIGGLWPKVTVKPIFS
jgi:hypothetical protein